MSTLPEPLQKRKVNISMMLKVPINIEIEFLASPSINKHQTEDKSEDIILSKIMRHSESKVVINGESIAELDHNSDPLISQIVNQLEQTVSLDSMLSSTEHETQIQDNSQSDIVKQSKSLKVLSTQECTDISSQILPDKKRNMLLFLDSFNDSFAFIANTVGTVLFLGKIVNYSWD